MAPLFLLLFPQHSYEAENTPVPQLDPIVVTATAQPSSLTHTPSTVTVITKSEIDQQQANRVSEVLQQVPGLFVDEMGGRGGISSVYVRGGDPNFTLVMIDGVPINDPTNQRGGSVDFSTLTPERIERVEIIRGPLSALYGSEAMSGVINIITTKGEEQTHQVVRAEGGRFGYTREVLQASGPLLPLHYALSLSHTRNDAQVKGDQFELGTVGWNFSLAKDQPYQLGLTGQYTQTSTRAFPEGSGGSRLALLRDTEKRDTQELTVGFTFSQSLRTNWQHDLSLNLFWRHQEVNSPGVLLAPGVFAIPPAQFETTYTRFNPRWTHTVEISPDSTFSSGVQLIEEIGDRSGSQELSALGLPADQPIDFDQTRTTGAVFVESSLAFFSRITLTGGARLDLPEGFKAELSPRIALRYQVTPSLTARAGYGEGFKLPGFAALGDPLIGNPSLGPETSRGWEVGFNQQTFNGKAALEITYFNNRFSNLIDLDPQLARQGIFRLTNLRKVSTQGVEFGVQITPTPTLSAKGSLTYLSTDIADTSDPLRNRPEWSGGMVLTAQPSPAWNLRTQIRAVGKRFDLQVPTTNTKVGGYVTADLALTYKPAPSWQLFGVLENLTNTNYENFLGFPAPEISFRLGVEYQPQK